MHSSPPSEAPTLSMPVVDRRPPPGVFDGGAIVEEVGEVARALEDDDSQLRVELVQVAAVAVAWLEALDAL